MGGRLAWNLQLLCKAQYTVRKWTFGFNLQLHCNQTFLLNVLTVLFLGSFLFKINTNVENNIKCMGTQKFSVFIFSVVEFSEWKFFLRIPHALWTLLFAIGPIDKKYLLPVSIMKRKWEVKCTLTQALYPLQIHHIYFKNNNLTFPYFFKSWTSPENSVLYIFPDMSCYYFIENKMRFMQM